jgi:hypothetical protein
MPEGRKVRQALCASNAEQKKYQAPAAELSGIEATHIFGYYCVFGLTPMVRRPGYFSFINVVVIANLQVASDGHCPQSPVQPLCSLRIRSVKP